MRQLVTKRRRKCLLVTAALIAVGVGIPFLPGVATGTVADPTPQPEADRLLPVAVEPLAAAGPYAVPRTYTGRLVARRVADLSFERSGRLVEVAVDDGARVARGARIAALETRDLEIALRGASAERAEAAARLDEMIAGPREQTVRAAQAAVADLEAQFTRMQAELERSRRLDRGGAISKTALDEATFGAQSLEARLDGAREQLAELQEGTRPERVRAQRALLDRIDARIAAIRLDLEKSVLRAPFDAIVARRVLDEGTVPAAGAPVVRLIEDGGLEARIGLPVDTARRVESEPVFRLTVDDREVAAELRAVLPELDERTRTRTAVLALTADAARGLVPGQIVRLHVEEESDARGHRVPTESLVKGSHGLWAVYVVRDGRIERRDVEVLHTDGAHALVRGAVEAGEDVVVRGVHRVADGQRVRVARAD